MSHEKSAASARGASSSYTGYGDMIRAWRAHHHHSALDALRRLSTSPVQTLMTGLVVAIALALPAALILVLHNVIELGERWDANPKVTVFLHLRADEAAIDALRRRVDAMPEVAAVTYLTPAEALAQFQAQAGFSGALDGLDQNPLPPTLIIAPRSEALSPLALQALTSRLAAEGVVDAVDLDLAWVQRLQAMMALGRAVVYGLAGLLVFGALLAVGNTVRLGIESRKEEILVTKLVGGTTSFVRRPFLYTGVWYGVLGGLLAALLVAMGVLALQGPVAALAATYGAEFALQGLGLRGAALLLACGSATGWLGAWLAVGRHLQQFEPR